MNLGTVLYNMILGPISQLIEIAYILFDKVFDNTGIALVGVSMTVTLLCLPLYIVAESWQETERNIQAKMKNNVNQIKQVFKGDEQYMILSTYYRQNHYHPIMALRSSFGILIQIPFFFAAYHILSSLPDLQGKSFLFIKDMGKPDAIFSIGGFAINILPIAMTLINCISGTIYSKGHGAREKIQIYGMAALFLIVLYNSPAGLVFYWTMNNIFSLVKNIFYKMKNPIKSFYYCMVVLLVFLSIYLLFVFHRASFKLKLIATIFIWALIPIPVYLKGINWLIKNFFSQIYTDSKKRFALFLTAELGLTFLCGLALPSGLISSSVQEFSNIDNYTNPVAFLHSSFWISFGLVIFWPTCVYFLFKEKVQTILSVAYSAIFAGALINAFIFVGSYGSMDETLKLIDGFKYPSVLFMALNVLVIFVSVFAVSFVIKFTKPKILTGFFALLTCSLAVISVINVNSISKEYKDFENKVSSQIDDKSSKYKFNLSKNKQNVVIFMLDRFASAYVNQILSEQKDIKENLTGFTYYPNCVSFNGHTLMGATPVYGGYDNTPYELNKRKDELIKDKLNQGILLMPRILTEQAGFNATLSDISWANASYVSDMSFISYYDSDKKEIVDNYPNIRGINLLSKYTGDFKREVLLPEYKGMSLSHVLNRNLFWTSLFRITPSPLRGAIYNKGTWWENGVPKSSSSFPDWFSLLYYMPKITDVSSEKPTLTIITNECTHSNEDISMYNLPLSGKISKKADNAYIIDTMALKQVSNFVTFLKENHVYDNTRIIVVSDHGIGSRGEENYTTQNLEDGYSKDHLNPVLLVKDFNTTEPFAVSNEFMTNADVPALALKSIVENPVNPFTGNPVNMDNKKDGVIVTTANLFMVYHSKSNYYYTVPEDSWFTVKDNIFVDSNWARLKAK